ncbi:interferon-induced helicase C domain-containing protein 1-like [Lytechinus pictus]|uniref:interferon-induced helicase C domain-containing protein 1-like n=1 Tax=Lytechinus pictus TaxID=7653 RepID=UPI0030B9F9E2
MTTVIMKRDRQKDVLLPPGRKKQMEEQGYSDKTTPMAQRTSTATLTTTTIFWTEKLKQSKLQSGSLRLGSESPSGPGTSGHQQLAGPPDRGSQVPSQSPGTPLGHTPGHPPHNSPGYDQSPTTANEPPSKVPGSQSINSPTSGNRYQHSVSNPNPGAGIGVQGPSPSPGTSQSQPPGYGQSPTIAYEPPSKVPGSQSINSPTSGNIYQYTVSNPNPGAGIGVQGPSPSPGTSQSQPQGYGQSPTIAYEPPSKVPGSQSINSPTRGNRYQHSVSNPNPGAGIGVQGPSPSPGSSQSQPPGCGQGPTVAYEQPIKVPGLQSTHSLTSGNRYQHSESNPNPGAGIGVQGPSQFLGTPKGLPHTRHPVSSPSSPGNGQGATSHGAIAPGSRSRSPESWHPHSTPPASPSSGNTGQNSGLSQNPGLKSKESLPVVPENAQINKLTSDLSYTEMAHSTHFSSPRSLKSNESRSSLESVADHGLKSSEPLRTMESGLVPGQVKTTSVAPAQLSPPHTNSLISSPSPLISNDPSGIHHANNDRDAQLHNSRPGSVISQARPLRSGSAAGSNELTDPEIPVPTQSSFHEAADTSKHTLEHGVQPSSTPDKLKDTIQRIVDLSLSQAEEMAASNSHQQQPVIGEGDTARDSANASSGAEDLPVDVVRDSASDPEQVGDSTVGALAASLLDFHQPPKEQRKPVTLRGYQKELADPGIKGVNYVICAPTGSGKTITAANICYENMMKMKKAGREEDFKAIFIVPTRHLKKQQRDGFQNLFVPGQVTSLAEGQMFSEALGRGNVRVLMITAQVLVNALTQNEFKITDVSMLVFDECHHTTLNHPYNEIMRYYLKEKKAILIRKGVREEQWPIGLSSGVGGIPQVVGLTASVGTGISNDAHGHIVTLCANLDSFGVKTVTREENIDEMKQHNKPPERDQILATPKRTPTPEISRFISILQTTMEEIETEVLAKHQRDYTNKDVAASSPTFGTQEYENWIAKIRVHAELRFPNLEICANYLFHLNLALMLYDDLRATDALESIEVFKLKTKGIQDDLPDGRHCRLIYEKYLQELKELASKENPLSNPKLLCLHEMIKKVYSKEPESKGIVLARTRFATHALLNFIEECGELAELDPPILPVRIVGQSREVDQGLTLARQDAALKEFKSGRKNLLVATDIVQEGLDIPACNLIIRYNFVSNEIGTVQAKGRARKEGSKCFLIVESRSVNEGRERKNRESVLEMDEAIKRANELPPRDWHHQIRQRQLSIIENIEMKDMMKKEQQERSKQVNVKLLCNKCEKFICKSSDLERRLSNYTCLDSSISDRTQIVRQGLMEFRESRTIGLVKCKCGNLLGQALEFKRLHVWKRGYNFSPKSFFFVYDDDPDSKKVFSKWKKVDFPIASEEQ